MSRGLRNAPRYAVLAERVASRFVAAVLLVGLVALVVGTVPGGYGVPPWVSLLLGGVVLYVVLRLRGRQADAEAAS